MKQTKKALALLLAAGLALSLCACELNKAGIYLEYILDVNEEGAIDYGMTLMTAREDPDIDGDGEPETPEEIIAAERESDEREGLPEYPLRRMRFAGRVIDGFAYVGISFYFYSEPAPALPFLADGRAEYDTSGESFTVKEPLFGESAVRSFGLVTLRIPTAELPQPAAEDEAVKEDEAAPGIEPEAEAGPEEEHAPSFQILTVRMPGKASTNAGTAEGEVVTIDLDDPSQWEGLDEIVISAPVFEPLAVILPAAGLLLAAAAIAVRLRVRRKKRAAPPPTEAPAASAETPDPAVETPAPIKEEAPPAEDAAPSDGGE